MLIVVLLMVATLAWLTRRYWYEPPATPQGEPDFTWGQNKEHRSLWAEAIDEYRKVHDSFPLDAESLFRIATILRDRIKDEEQYLATLSEIVRLPDDAGPAWILVEARDRLLRLGDADPDQGPTVQRPGEIELPEDEQPWGRFGPEG